MKNKASYLGLLICFLIFSCGSKKENKNYENVTTANYAMEEKSAAGNGNSVTETVKFTPPVVKENAVEDEDSPKDSKVVNKKKIIKNGTISIKSNDITLSK